MTNEEIENIFNGRFEIGLISHNPNTMAPRFNFIDRKYNESYSIEYNYLTDYDSFKINHLQSIVDSIVEVRDEKINIILDENENKCGNSNFI